MIPYGRQDITKEDIDAVVEVLKSDYLTQGPAVPAFENVVAQYCNVKYSIAINSATSALHIACLALGLKEGDWLWTSPVSFVASANCGLYCGANIDFVDIDPGTYNLSPIALELKLIKAEKEGKLPKIIIPVHLSGQSCDMQAIFNLSKKYGFKIIEDASHAVGGKYLGRPIGSCEYSDITIFSFHPVKIITTGEGGIAVTNDMDLADKMFLLRSHGITRDQNLMSKKPDGPWYYEQICLGFNYRMTDIQAALGISQMNRIDALISRRHEIADYYDKALSTYVVTPFQHADSYSAKHLYIIRLKLENDNKTHLGIFEALRNSGVGVNLHYIPIYRQPYYKKYGYIYDNYPEAEKYYSEAISIPIYSALSDESQDKVVNTIINVLND